MKKVYIIIFIAFTASCIAQVKLKHGLLLGGGGESPVSGATLSISDAIWEGAPYRLRLGIITSNYNYMIGYRFRIKPLKRKMFYDIDMIIGGRRINSEIGSEETQPVVISTPTDEYNYMYYIHYYHQIFGYFALSLTYNYQTYKGFYAGAGLSPEYQYMTDIHGFYNTTIDIPVILKMGYELKGIDFSFSYRIGTTSNVSGDIYKHGRINEWRVQLFIPF